MNGTQVKSVFLNALLLVAAAGAFPFFAALSAQELVLTGHEGGVTAAGFAADGTLVVTSSSDSTVRVWDSQTGTQIRTHSDHTAPVLCMGVTANGRRVASGAQDNTVRLWDLPSPLPLESIRISDTPVASFAASADGRTLFCVGQAGLMVLSATHLSEDAAQLATVQPSAGPQLTCLSVRSDGVFVATGDQHGRVTIWSPLLQQTQLEFQGGERALAAVWFNGTAMVCVDVECHVNVWQLADAVAGKTQKNEAGEDVAVVPTLLRTFQPHPERLSCAISHNIGSQILSASGAGNVVLSDINNGNVLKEFNTNGETCRCVAVRSDNQRVAAGTISGKVMIWNAGNSELVQTLDIDAPVSQIAWSADRLKLAVAGDAGHMHIFGPSLPSTPPQELVSHQTIAVSTKVTSLLFAADSLSVWSAGADGIMNRWGYASPLQLRQLNHGGAVYGIAMAHRGNSIVTCGVDQIVRVWDTETGQARAQMRGHQGAVHAVALNAEDTFAVTSGEDGTIRLWDLVGGRQLKQLTRLDSTIYSLAVHPAGQHIVAAGADRTVYVIDIASGDILRALKGHTDFIHRVCITKGGRRLLTYGYAGNLKIWDFELGAEISSQRIGQIGNFADYSPDEKRIVLANGDGTATLIPVP